MTEAKIFLTPNDANPLGVIGEVPDGKGGMIKGTTLVDVMAQVAKFPQSDYLFLCAGPGGDVEVGNQIHDYMESLKGLGKKVNTATVGDVGSILTKLFLAGDERTMREEDKFYVHAPWVPHLEGNATQVSKGLAGLIADENKLLQFYQSKTGITEAGLKGLMDGTSDQDGTFINADQAVALKFATKKATSKIKAYAQIKNITMAETKTLGAKIGALIDMALGNATPGAAPATTAKAIDLDAEGGKKISVNTEDPANLVGADATTTDEAGATSPVPDGEHKLADGRILVVAGGKVAEVKPAAAAQQQPAAAAAAPAPTAAEQALQAKLTALEQTNAAQAQKIAQLEKVDVAALVNAKFDELKASMPGVGKTPTKGFNNLGNNGAQGEGPVLSVIQQKMVALQKQQTATA